MGSIFQSIFAPTRVPDNLWNRIKTYFETEEAQDRVPAPISAKMVAIRRQMGHFFRSKTESNYLLLRKNIERLTPGNIFFYIRGNYYLRLLSVLFDCFECMSQKLTSFPIPVLPSIPADLLLKVQGFTMTLLSKEKKMSYLTYSNPDFEQWRQGHAPGVQHNPLHGEWIVYDQETPSCLQDRVNISTNYYTGLNNLPADILQYICQFRTSERLPSAQDAPPILNEMRNNYGWRLQELSSLFLAHECVKQIPFTAGKLSSTCRRFHQILAPELQRAKQWVRLIKAILSHRRYYPLDYVTIYQCLSRGFYWETIRFYLHLDPSVLIPDDNHALRNPSTISADYLVLDRNLVKFLLKVCKKHEIEWFQSRLYQQIQEGIHSNDGQKLQRALDLQEFLGEKEMHYVAQHGFAIRLLRRLS